LENPNALMSAAAHRDQVSMGCWQRLEIMVRIGYMHNAAHPQSLPPARWSLSGKKKQLPGCCTVYLTVL
jgi:hypothetical protein